MIFNYIFYNQAPYMWRKDFIFFNTLNCRKKHDEDSDDRSHRKDIWNFFLEFVVNTVLQKQDWKGKKNRDSSIQ